MMLRLLILDLTQQMPLQAKLQGSFQTIPELPFMAWDLGLVEKLYRHQFSSVHLNRKK